jgi:hypothetical protein
MATEKTPIRTVFADDGSAEGLAEFQTGEVVGYEHGGTGLDSLGSANQVLQVAANGNAIVWGNKTQVDLDPYLQVANATATFQTKVEALAANNSLVSLIEDRIQVANVYTNFVPKTASVQLSGDATGSATFASNTASITVDISSTGTPTGTFGSASQVPVITVAADGRITNISNTAVAGVDSVAYSTANGNLTINTSDGGAQTTTITLQPFDTDNLTEGATNQYFTNARARSAFTGGAGINITDGVISQESTIDYGLIDGAVTITGDYGSI